MEIEKVDVVFVVDTKREDWLQDVIAFFPDVKWGNASGSNASYAHYGQHGPCDESFVVEDCRAATFDEYKPLLKELKSIGYEPKVIDAEWWINERKVA